MAMRKRQEEVSSVSLRVRVTPAEATEIRESAARHGLSLSEFMRRKSLGLVCVNKVDQQMIRELCRIGGLLKHVHAESGGAYSQTTAQMLHELRLAIKRIASDDHDLQIR